MLSKLWERTDDTFGYRPKFKMDCLYCKKKMVPRYSFLFPDGQALYGIYGAGVQLAFKCPRCGFHQRFNLEDDKEYIQKILDYRNGKVQYNPVPEWEQDEKIKAQLTALGYFGNNR